MLNLCFLQTISPFDKIHYTFVKKLQYMCALDDLNFLFINPNVQHQNLNIVFKNVLNSFFL